jgi:hypothetical protein
MADMAKQSKNKKPDAPRYSDRTGSKAAASFSAPTTPTTRKARRKSAVPT